MLKAQTYECLQYLARRGNLERYNRLIASRPAAELNAEFLADLLHFCQANNAYYRRLLGDGPLPRLTSLPPLTKSVIRENFEELKSNGLRAKTYLNSSGGSTGIPQSFLQDRVYQNWSVATEAYYFRAFHGIKAHRVRKVVLWGSERDTFKQRDLRGKLSHWFTNTLFLNTFNVTEEKWLDYLQTINRYRPYFIKGYAGSLYELARLINRHKIKPHRPRFVYSSAEMLRDFMRQEIESAFGAKVYDFYGSREVGPIAGECVQGRRHIFTFNNHIEVVGDDGGSLPEGEAGRILVTNLHNYSMPLLRYDIGDTGSLSTSPCPCANPLPYLIELKGRVTDHFRRPGGAVVHGEYFTHLFYFRPWVREFQVNQLAPDHVQMCIVKLSEPPAAELAEVEEKVRLVMGGDCRISWEYVAAIPRTPQGKHLFTRCLLE